MRYFLKIAVLACACFRHSHCRGGPDADPGAGEEAGDRGESAGEPRRLPIDPALLQPATLKAKAPAEYDVKFVTTAGEFTVKVTRAWAPNGADRFYNLVRHHFYDGAAFFRVLPGFMAQFGMSAYPEVSKVWETATIKDDPIVQSNHRGFVSFATAGPNTRTTQVFINYGNNEALDRSGFSAFAVVTDGMEVVDKLYNGYGEGAPDGHGPDQGLIGSLRARVSGKGFSQAGQHPVRDARARCGSARSGQVSLWS